MSLENFVGPLFGGVLIGLSASLLLVLKGRVFGVSGILAGVLSPETGETTWRIAALVGLLSAGVLFQCFSPELLVGETNGSVSRYVIAGLLVGFGTQLGSGCTSGHGVCGISRMSPRSIIATVTFILFGMIVVGVIRCAGGAM
jgi:uncharacterized membrane protein YedE/YeeE